jgi:hypothetical protein
MITRIIEVTNGEANWGKFLLARFDSEWECTSLVSPGRPLIAGRGWDRNTLLVLDLQTGEGALFRPGGLASADLAKHAIWVCPMYEPFLEWLWKQPDPMAVPNIVNLPDAPFAMAGYRRSGPEIRGCPCLHTTPCHDRCACVMPTSSSGCSRCCAYGSPEQQRAMAILLAAALDQRVGDIHSDQRARARWERVERTMAIVDLARKIGEHWRTQEGVNGALLDHLAQLTGEPLPDRTRCDFCEAVCRQVEDPASRNPCPDHGTPWMRSGV